VWPGLPLLPPFFCDRKSILLGAEVVRRRETFRRWRHFRSPVTSHGATQPATHHRTQACPQGTTGTRSYNTADGGPGHGTNVSRPGICAGSSGILHHGPPAGLDITGHATYGVGRFADAPGSHFGRRMQALSQGRQGHDGTQSHQDQRQRRCLGQSLRGCLENSDFLTPLKWLPFSISPARRNNELNIELILPQN